MNWTKFKELSFKKKLQWLVNYYGIAALVFIVAVIVIISLIKSVLFPTPIADVCVLVISDTISADDGNDMENELLSITGKEVSIDAYNPNDVYGMQAVAAKIMSDQIDIVVYMEDQAKDVMSNGYIISYEKASENVYVGMTQRARQTEEVAKTYEYLINKLK